MSNRRLPAVAAAAAATATTTATATATTTATATATTTTAATTLGARLGFVDLEVAAVELHAVHLFDALLRFSPHYWFNEGMGDFFSGALIRSGKVKKIGVHPWRVGLVQAALNGQRGYKPIALSKLIEYEREDFYDPEKRAVCYAEAWSLVYFLRTAKEVARHDRWSRILDAYLETLKEEYARRTAEQEDEETSEKKKKHEIAKSARDAALQKAFDGIGLLELERAWWDYTVSLRGPR